MGYYSDVILCVPKADYDAVLAHPESEIHKELIQHNCIKSINCSGIEWTIIYFYDVKWYESFNDVITITNWYSKLPEYQFYRLGEDFGDCDVENNSEEENLFYPDQVLSENF